jgi:hypothetical protein
MRAVEYHYTVPHVSCPHTHTLLSSPAKPFNVETVPPQVRHTALEHTRSNIFLLIACLISALNKGFLCFLNNVSN